MMISNQDLVVSLMKTHNQTLTQITFDRRAYESTHRLLSYHGIVYAANRSAMVKQLKRLEPLPIGKAEDFTNTFLSLNYNFS